MENTLFPFRMDQSSPPGLPIPWDHSLTAWLGQADSSSGLSFPSEGEGFQSRWPSTRIPGLSPPKLKVGAHISRSLQAVSRKIKRRTSFRRAGSVPEQAWEGTQSQPEQPPCGVRVGHWRDEGLGQGEGLSPFRTPPMGHSDGRSLGDVWMGDRKDLWPAQLPDAAGSAAARPGPAGVAVFQFNDVRGGDGGGGESHPHGKSPKLCACDARGRDGWHRAACRRADGGFGESRSSAPGGPEPGSPRRIPGERPAAGVSPRPWTGAKANFVEI